MSGEERVDNETKLNLLAKEMGDRFNEVLREHDEEVHEGERCEDERLNILAYLIHRMGAPGDDHSWIRFFGLLKLRVEDYSVMHVENHRHEHDHNGDGPHG
jgi:hypothetical protein